MVKTLEKADTRDPGKRRLTTEMAKGESKHSEIVIGEIVIVIANHNTPKS